MSEYSHKYITLEHEKDSWSMQCREMRDRHFAALQREREEALLRYDKLKNHLTKDAMVEAMKLTNTSASESKPICEY